MSTEKGQSPLSYKSSTRQEPAHVDADVNMNTSAMPLRTHLSFPGCSDKLIQI